MARGQKGSRQENTCPYAAGRFLQVWRLLVDQPGVYLTQQAILGHRLIVKLWNTLGSLDDDTRSDVKLIALKGI